MPHNRRFFALLLTGLLGLALGRPAPAAAQGSGGTFEAGLLYQSLGGAFAPWRGVYLQGFRQHGAYETWRIEAAFHQRFGDQGFFYKAQTTRPLTRRAFFRAAAGVGNGGFFLPRFSADLQLARKWGRRERLVTVVGAAVYDAHDVHRDYALTVEAQYYLAAAWIVQGSVRFNHSTPGPAASRYHFLALTHGRPAQRYLTLRLAFGREAYVLVDPLTTYTDFSSRDLLFTWREWVRRDWGFNLSLMHYANPYYRRHGVQLGFFKAL